MDEKKMNELHNIDFNSVGCIKRISPEFAQPSDIPIISSINCEGTDSILCMTIVTRHGTFEPCYLDHSMVIKLRNLFDRVLNEVQAL